MQAENQPNEETKQISSNGPLKIIVRLRRHYGKENFDALNDNAKIILKLMRRKVFVKDELALMKNLGWDVEVKVDEYRL